MERITDNIILPDPLSRHIRSIGVDVYQNFLNYPLLTKEFSAQELLMIGHVKDALLQLPLTHSTKLPFNDDILPFSEIISDKPKGNTGQLDIDLGLDKCTFMQWGAVERSSGYGAFHILVDPSKVLLDPRCFVTPVDIGQIAFPADNPLNSFSKVVQKELKEKYFSKILPGKDWLEFNARKIYLQTKSGSAVSLNSVREFGEIKFFGSIPKSSFIESVGPEDERRVWANLYRKGFIVGPVARSYPFSSSNYDVSPEQLGLGGAEAVEFWNTLYNDAAKFVVAQEVDNVLD